MLLRSGSRRRTALATATVLIVTGLCATTHGVALADDPAPLPSPIADEVVIPDPGRFQPRGEDITSAGGTGYVHRQEGSPGPVWTDYASGADGPLPPGHALSHSGLFPALSAGSVAQTRTLTVTSGDTPARASVTLPPGRRWAQAYNADTALTYTSATDNRITGLYLRRSVDGATVERPVTGLGTAYGLKVVHQDTRGAWLTTQTAPGGATAAYLLDHRTATVTPSAVVKTGSPASVALGGRHYLLQYGAEETVHTVPRDNPSAPPVATPLPPAGHGEDRYLPASFTVIGDWIVVRRAPLVLDSPGGGGTAPIGTRLLAVPLGGGPARELLPYAAAGFTTAPDGSVLVTGGTGAKEWAVRRITLGADGAPRLTTVRKVPHVPATYNGLAVGGGRVSHLSNTQSPWALYEVDTAAPTEARERYRGRDWVLQGLRDLGDGQSAFVDENTLISTGPDRTRGVTVPVDSTPVDAAGRYAVTEGDGTQYVVDFGDGRGATVLLTRAPTAASVWAGELWKPAPATGTVNAYDLVTKATSPAVDLGSGCVPDELQAVGRWLYWSCDGKAGVYDQVLRKSVGVPAGEALLGDGFLVRRDNAAGRLLLTDALTGQTSVFADVPATAAAAGSGRRVDWSVDRFGGGVAYVDALRNIHVKPVPIAPQPLTLLESSVDPSFSAIDPADRTWDALWRLSRPAARSKVVIRDASGQAVRTLDGPGGPGAAVTARWDGRNDAGGLVPEGPYRYTLDVQVDEGGGFVRQASGDVVAYDTIPSPAS
ncbi:FlgD immunoglobulin-like domain containing protein [Streptomyces sp. NPDC002992]|uniref:FlgD immunoglobulin-like domain containing protein n=1 Tax=Streptomyces sp. NPDC002992 TaxID=3154273 RepID=UPI00339ED218